MEGCPWYIVKYTIKYRMLCVLCFICVEKETGNTCVGRYTEARMCGGCLWRAARDRQPCAPPGRHLGVGGTLMLLCVPSHTVWEKNFYSTHAPALCYIHNTQAHTNALACFPLLLSTKQLSPLTMRDPGNWSNRSRKIFINVLTAGVTYSHVFAFTCGSRWMIRWGDGKWRPGAPRPAAWGQGDGKGCGLSSSTWAPEVEELPGTGFSFPLWILLTHSDVLELGPFCIY